MRPFLNNSGFSLFCVWISILFLFSGMCAIFSAYNISFDDDTWLIEADFLVGVGVGITVFSSFLLILVRGSCRPYQWMIVAVFVSTSILASFNWFASFRQDWIQRRDLAFEESLLEVEIVIRHLVPLVQEYIVQHGEPPESIAELSPYLNEKDLSSIERGQIQIHIHIVDQSMEYEISGMVQRPFDPMLVFFRSYRPEEGVVRESFW